MQEQIKNEGLFETIILLGGFSAVGRKLKVKPQAVTQWVYKNSIPLNRIPALIEFGKQVKIDVSLKKIRPDIDWETIKQANI
jgi:DNA-binding transcriptional regulator YdaS (Cro superfamily)